MSDRSIVLIVDDERFNITVLQELLEAEYDIMVAKNGEQALSCVAAAPLPDLILLDIMMPKMDGMEVCRRLKAMPQICDIPVIFVTAKAEVEDELEGFKVGAVDYINKPINPAVVQTRVKTHLELHAARRELRKNNEQLNDYNTQLGISLERLMASEEHFRSLVQTVPDIVYKINSEGNFTFLNDAVARLGYRPVELLGKHFSEIIYLPDVANVSRKQVLDDIKGQKIAAQPKLFDEQRSGERMTAGLEVRLKLKSGACGEVVEIESIGEQLLFVEINCSGLYGEHLDPRSSHKERNYVGTVGVIRDITERKRIERQLQEAKNKAEEATNMKDKFVSLVAHDIRSPLCSVAGLIELILKQGVSIKERHKQLLSQAMISCQNLIVMVEEVLNISRLRSGKLTPKMQFFNVYVCVADIAQRLDYQLCEKDINLANQLAKNTRLYADMHLFSEVVQNLITNAIKFSNKNATITLLPVGNNQSGIAVQDQGVGIRPEIIPKLFNVAEKISTPGTAGEQGTGFGLPFSFDIMQAHGGSLEVTSAVGQGSLFSAILPDVKPIVLIVDDDELDRLAIQAHVATIDAVILEADSVQAATDLLQQHTPHLIICDIVMPERDGFQLLQIIKGDPHTKHIAVMMITGSEVAAHRDACFRLGANDYTIKPIDPDDFLPRMRHQLGG